MSKKRIVVSSVIVIFTILINVLLIRYQPLAKNYDLNMEITLVSDKENGMQMFYLERGDEPEDGFVEGKSQMINYEKTGKGQKLIYTIAGDTSYIRFDLGEGMSNTEIETLVLKCKDVTKKISVDELVKVQDTKCVQVEKQGEVLHIVADSEDPYLIWNTEKWGISSVVQEANERNQNILKTVLLISLDFLILLVLLFWNKLIEIPLEALRNRKLVLRLSKNDFKTKFAGSYLGTIWAFIQPVVTVLVYWFVFEKGLKAGGINTRAGITAPFVLWLVAGLVPWFFFSDALNGGTNALVEYSYLVKKVVFKISILPIVKVISALFVHVFFIAFTLVLYAGYHYYPDIYTLQIFYYSFCVFVFTLGLSYANAAIVVFFRDWTQIINIILQVGIWMTPIMWNIDAMELSPVLITIFKLNPMYYIVAGYREALIGKTWFWENPTLTIYFWVVTIAVFGVGTAIFRKLRVHFADVL